jgi:perosamine synthetase
MFKKVVDFIRELYRMPEGIVPLHAPVFMGDEKKNLNECIDTTVVSYVGQFVKQFEDMTAKYAGVENAIATVNGTTALHVSLLLAGVNAGDEVITQPLTFVATVNAIRHANADPVFVDVDTDTLGMSPEKLEHFFKTDVEMRGGECRNRKTGKSIKAVLPMHTFGHPCRIDEIVTVCNRYSLPVIEDAAESLGSWYRGKHSGTFGLAGIFSYNGNKIITTGGGGMIITNDSDFARRARHITATSKIQHPWNYIHDETGYNYRMPNVNAAIGTAQMEKLDFFLRNKRETADCYSRFFDTAGIPFMTEPEQAASNYWLNAIFLKDIEERDRFLEYTNKRGVTTRPAWRLMHRLAMYETCQSGPLENAEAISDRLVNIPSSVRMTA